MTTAAAMAGTSTGSYLILNAGSSSLKFALFGGGTDPVRILSGTVDRMGLAEATFTLRTIESQQTEHPHLHVGYKEEGTTSTPFDMVVMNDLDRFHLVADVMDRVPQLGARAACAKQAVHDKLIEHKRYIAEYGEDMPEIRNWKWASAK